MTKNVTITVTGIQYDEDGQQSVTELNVMGQYYERDGCRYLLYEESDADTGTVMKNLLKINDFCMELTKSGAISSRMLFQRGETVRTGYASAFGTLHFDLHTELYKSFWTDTTGIITTEYDLSADNILISKNRLTIKVKNG